MNREPKHYECSALTIELQAHRHMLAEAGATFNSRRKKLIVHRVPLTDFAFLLPRKRAKNRPQLLPGVPIQGLFPAVRDAHDRVFAFPAECFNVSCVCMICPVVNYERFTNNRRRNDSRNCQTTVVSPAKLENSQLE